MLLIIIIMTADIANRPVTVIAVDNLQGKKDPTEACQKYYQDDFIQFCSFCTIFVVLVAFVDRQREYSEKYSGGFAPHLWRTASWWSSPPAAQSPPVPAGHRTCWIAEMVKMIKMRLHHIMYFKPGADCENGDCEEESRRSKSSLETEPFPRKAGQLLYWRLFLLVDFWTSLHHFDVQDTRRKTMKIRKPYHVVVQMKVVGVPEWNTFKCSSGCSKVLEEWGIRICGNIIVIES